MGKSVFDALIEWTFSQAFRTPNLATRHASFVGNAPVEFKMRLAHQICMLLYAGAYERFKHLTRETAEGVVKSGGRLQRRKIEKTVLSHVHFF